MRLKYHPRARIELNEAVDFYEERQEGLGWQFLDEIQLAIRRILDFPDAWQPSSTNTRRCLTHRFPYELIYQVKHHEVRVIAICHQKRKPGYWRSRLTKS